MVRALGKRKHFNVLLGVSAAALLFFGCREDGGRETATLLVETSPRSGAEVVIGGIPYGPTPCTVRGIPAGKTYILVSLDGYKRQSKMIDVPETGEKRILVELEPLSGHLSIESEPVLAKVYLDGVYIGETPIRNYLVPVGEHTYELRKENYVTLTKTIVVKEDFRFSLSHALEPMKAQLTILSRPPNATIWLNDIRQLKTTSAKFDLMPGTYLVAVHTKGYVTEESVLQLSANEKRVLNLELKEGDVPEGMVLVPAGEFIFGVDESSPDERPKKKVLLDAFFIDKFEVTNAQFQRVYPSHKFDPNHGDMPVSGVTWNQADAYARTSGKRLPTEQEWEKAARGVDGREYPWGNRFEPKWFNGKDVLGSRPKKPGSFREGVSPFGCMDMAGNVYEWTRDWYGPYPGNPDVNTNYGNIYRVLRGGSYLSDRFDVRCARRHFARPEDAREDYGFRCAMDVPDAPSD